MLGLLGNFFSITHLTNYIGITYVLLKSMIGKIKNLHVFKKINIFHNNLILSQSYAKHLGQWLFLGLKFDGCHTNRLTF